MVDGDYQVLVAKGVQEWLEQLDEKSERIVRDNLTKLSDPHPGRGQGDKERLTDEIHRLHIGRTWTAFYAIDDHENVVEVMDVLSIDEAHKKYGDLD